MRDLGAVARVLACSRVYETAPWGDVPQGPYLNAAALVGYRGTAEELLAALLEIERKNGRIRDVRFGPRTLDLDLLWMEGVALDGATLTVPHPRLAERAFALWPLVDVAPFATDHRGERYARPAPDGITGILGPLEP